MVVKRCPDCDQTLPVACKSCTCGHVFVSRKQQQQQQQQQHHQQQQQDKYLQACGSVEGDSSNSDSSRDKRLRQDRVKKEIPDFDYDYTLVTSALSDPLTIPRENVNSSIMLTESEWFNQAVETRQPGFDIINIKRKRGRPKGSKNKPKSELLSSKQDPDHDGPKWDESGHPILTKKKRGRPKGSKNKPKDGSAKNNACAGEASDDDSDGPGGAAGRPIVDVMPRISKEKAAMYSIILSDINQKMLSQSSMKLVLS